MCHRGFCMTRDGTFRVSAGQSLQDQTRVLMICGSLPALHGIGLRWHWGFGGYRMLGLRHTAATDGSLRRHRRDDPLQIIERGELHDDFSLTLTQLDPHARFEDIREAVGEFTQAGHNWLLCGLLPLRLRAVAIPDRDDLFDRTD